jgi:hypothetical protein
MFLAFLYITWVVFMSFEGIREGHYWFWLFKSNGLPSNEHKLWTVQRSVVYLIIIVCISMTNYAIENVLLFALCLLISSPFFHDGFYYQTRHKLDNTIYKKGFFDQSTSSTALLTKFCTPILRTLYLLISLLIFIIFVLGVF